MTAKLTVWLENNDGAYELVKTLFVPGSDRLDQECVRGRWGVSGSGTFSWSPAVRALAQLLIRAKLHDDTITAALEGSAHSAAASLDYALAKKPNWLLDMFGIQMNGTPVCRELFLRINPERKRAGPVHVALRDNALPPSEITIVIDGVPCRSRTQLAAVEKVLEFYWHAAPRKARVMEDESAAVRQPSSLLTGDAWRSFLKTSFRNETLNMLRSTPIFDRPRMSKMMDAVTGSPLFRKVSGKRTFDLLESSLILSANDRLGMLQHGEELIRAWNRERPFSIAIDVTSVPSILLFKYLESVRKFPIELHYRFIDTTEMVRHLLRGDFPVPIDACVISMPAAASLFGKGRKPSFSPLMVFPRVSHRVVARRGAHTSLIDGQYLFMTDIPGTSYFYFDRLSRSGLAGGPRAAKLHTDPDEAFGFLRDAPQDYRAVLFFPHYDLNMIFNDCIFLDRDTPIDKGIEHALFIEHEISRDTRFTSLLDIALRDAWLALQSGGEILDVLLDQLLNDPSYIEMLHRCCGLHALAPHAAPTPLAANSGAG